MNFLRLLIKILGYSGLALIYVFCVLSLLSDVPFVPTKIALVPFWTIIPFLPIMIRGYQIKSGTRTASKGSRFAKIIKFSGDFAKMGDLIDNFLRTSGYRILSYGDEIVYYRDGECFKFSIKPEGILIEAFVIILTFIEDDLEDSIGLIGKRALKKTVDKTIVMIEDDEKNRLSAQNEVQ